MTLATFNGTGSRGGQTFNIQNGTYYPKYPGSSLIINFDIIYDDRGISEKFSGEVFFTAFGAPISITGTTTILDQSQIDGPGAAMGAYNNYSARVTLS